MYGIILMPSFSYIKMCCQWYSYLSTHSVRPVGSSRRWLSSVSDWHKRKHGALCKQAYLLFVGQEIMLCDPGIIGPPEAASLLAVRSLLSALCLSLSPSALFLQSHPYSMTWCFSLFPLSLSKGVSHRIVLNSACPEYWVFDSKGVF